MSLTFKPFSDFGVVVGMKAKGKTKFTKFWVKRLTRILALDPTWQLGDLGYCVHTPNQLAAAFQRFNKVIFQPKEATDEYYIAFFKIARQFCNYTLIIDEVDEFLAAKYIKFPDAKTIVVSGRAQGIGLICNTRRPHDINKAVRSNADHVICFKMQETDDLKYMAEWIGKTAQEIKDLPDFHSYYYDVRDGKTVLQTPCPLV